MVDLSPARFTLDDLAESSGLNKRTIRYYIDQGIVSPALGRSRSAYYTPSHLEELERAKRLREQGYSLDEIREGRRPVAAADPAGERWERIAIHPALEIHVRADAPPYVRELVARLLDEADSWFGNASDQHDNS